MRRYLSKTTVWQRLSQGLVLLGSSTTGSVDLYHAYIDHQRRHYEIDHAHWDWTVPDNWYRQSHS